MQVGSAGRMLERLQRIGDALRVDHAGDEHEIGTMIIRRPSGPTGVSYGMHLYFELIKAGRLVDSHPI
jgi:hypothetical protein